MSSTTVDIAAPPVWLLQAIAVMAMIALGIWIERNRFGGTHDLVDERTAAREQIAELTMTVDELVDENARLRGEVDTRRASSMSAHPTSRRDRLHLVAGGGVQ